ncbi:hypothetical protein PGT21_021980 [Puccinia graminis f. sp. tritici]|uniref:Uncharacterized protein n=1 Tax=Puccinia graminis f. sp. tritici TaxID=56615 RepID=A0A5B0QUT0_PUCGR|nr:hypothetical protein PGT21_021980 [Puccinia graminis f. sp. tritici]
MLLGPDGSLFLSPLPAGESLVLAHSTSGYSAPRRSRDADFDKFEIELAEHILPILKLSRLLLKKLSKRGLSGEEGIESYTELSSKQLTSLLEFGSKLHISVTGIARTIRGLIPPVNYERVGRSLRSMAKPLNTKFEVPLAIISSCFVPMLATDVDGFSVQNYYREWMVTWSTQFGVAIGNFNDGLRLYERHPPYIERSRLW